MTEIAKALDLDKSQVSRSLRVLAEYGFVDRDPKTRAYRLGWRLFSMAQGGSHARLVECCTPFLDELLLRVDESVYVSVVAGLEARTIAQKNPAHTIQAAGGRWPLYSTSVGRVLLAGKSIAEVRAVLPNGGSISTSKESVDSERLLEAVTQAGSEGYSVVVDEFEVGLTAVAAPIVDSRGSVVAALGVSGPTFRLAPKLQAAIVDVQTYARSISDAMSHYPVSS